MVTIQPVILCGGSGTRLWPASRAKYPKQFMRLGNGKTLFGETLRRIDYLRNAKSPLVISNDDYRFYAGVALQNENKTGTIILEPVSRNTAPAIALAAFAALENGDELLLVLPADHQLEEPEIFYQAVEQARNVAESGYLVTFGIKSSAPETGYGYIQGGNPIENGVYHVAKFHEKPEKSQAEAMLGKGGYYWNSGIFLFKASVYLDELRNFTPDIYAAVKQSWDERTTDLTFLRPGQIFGSSPANSIDYAIMEHTTKAAMVPVDCGWSDLGSWEAFYEAAAKDDNENVCEGDVITENTSNCYLRSSGRLIAALDVQNLAVVETKDAILVTDRRKTQSVKNVVERLKLEKRTEFDTHLEVYRPWGSYETLALSDRFQVKRIVVNPGAENSLQLHYHRAEHWIVVSGTAQITVGKKVQLLKENESVYVPLGEEHRIKNPGTIPLVLIEVQSGSYVGEDDIVRLEDNYGRADMENEA